MTLKISESLSLPIDAVTQKFGILGTSGSGKSYAALKLAELMLDAGAQIVGVDPVGIWWSLRLAKDGKRSGYDQVRVFGGDHGDLPLTPEAGSLVGRLLAERRISAVLDVSQFLTGEMKRFLTDFAESFFQAKKSHKSPVHLFLEECQTYIPESSSDREDPKMINRWERLIKFYRNYGGGTSMISQQPQSVSKKVLNLADTLFAMRTIGSHERKAIEKWVKDVIESESDLVASLPKLPTGTAHLWSPSWLGISRDIKILPRVTFDAGKTPEMGAVEEVQPLPLTPVDVEQLKTEMSDLIEKVKADDPKELRKRIADLERQLRTAPSASTPPPEIDVDALAKQVTDAANRERDKLWGMAIGRYKSNLLNEFSGMLMALEVESPSEFADTKIMLPSSLPVKVGVPSPVRTPRVPSAPTTASNGDLSGPERKIMVAMAELASIGKDQPKVEMVAAWAGYSPIGGAFGNPRGQLRSRGLVDYPSPGLMSLSPAGRSKIGVMPAPTQEEIWQRIERTCTGPEQKILRALLDRAGQREISKDQLADFSGYSPIGGAFGNPIGSLRTKGLLDYPRPGVVKAAEWLFL